MIGEYDLRCLVGFGCWGTSTPIPELSEGWAFGWFVETGSYFSTGADEFSQCGFGILLRNARRHIVGRRFWVDSRFG